MVNIIFSGNKPINIRAGDLTNFTIISEKLRINFAGKQTQTKKAVSLTNALVTINNVSYFSPSLNVYFLDNVYSVYMSARTEKVSDFVYDEVNFLRIKKLLKNLRMKAVGFSDISDHMYIDKIEESYLKNYLVKKYIKR